MNATVQEVNEIARIVVDSAIHVHKQLGPGLLESVYETVLKFVLEKRGLKVERQKTVPIVFEDLVIPEAFRADLVVEQLVVLELKSVEALAPVHAKQLMTYLRLLKYKLGFLLNFGAPVMKEGILRLVNGL